MCDASVRESAKAPSPDPRTRPMRGRKEVRDATNWAAYSAQLKSAFVVIHLVTSLAVAQQNPRQYFFSNLASSPSNFHCSRARSFAVRNLPQPAEGFSAPSESPAHADAGRNAPFVSAHKLSPGRKL